MARFETENSPAPHVEHMSQASSNVCGEFVSALYDGAMGNALVSLSQTAGTESNNAL